METVYETALLIVETNGSGEIFIQRKRQGMPDWKQPQIRVGACQDGMVITAAQHQMTPWASNGLPAFLVQ